MHKKIILLGIAIFLLIGMGYAQSDFPWIENFEDSTFPPDNWERFQVTGTSTWARNVYTTHNNSAGSAMCGFAANNNDSWFVSPEIVIPSDGGYALSFWSYIVFPSAYGSSEVHISTGSNNPASGDFELVKLISGADVVAAWREISVSLIPYSGSAIYIGFRYTGFYGHDWAIDDISISALSDSPVFDGPSSLSVGTVDSSESEPVTKGYSFTNNGAVPLTVDFISASPEITVTGLPLTVNYKEAATFSVIFNSYELPPGAYSGNFVLSTNDPNQPQITVSVSADVILFSPTITEFPWTEGFELPLFPLPYWEQYQISGTSNWSRNTYYAHNSSGAAYHPGFVADAETWLVTPEFVLSETKAYTLEFWSYIVFPTMYQSSDIYISTGSKNPEDGDYVLVKHLSGTEIEQDWQLISVSLSEYSGNSVYIAFKITTFDGHGWAIDDLKITEEGTSITIFPWTEGFEDSDFPPNNWSKVKIEGVMEWTRTTSTTFNGSSGAAYHNFGSGAHNSWLITPEIVLPASGGYALDFWSYIASPSFYGSSDVYISTGSNDPTSDDFVLVKHISGPDVAAAWRNIIVSLIPYSGNSIYIGFKYSGNFMHGWAVDNVSIYALSDNPVFEGSSSLDVGTVDSSESEPVTKEYGFINNGATPLTVNFISASPEITVTGLPLTVNFNEWTTFSVIFNSYELPSGAYSGNIVLSTNDPNQPQITVNVSANVVLFSPTITEFPWTEDFELPIFPLPYWEQYQISGTSNWSRNSYYSHNSLGAAYHPGFVGNAETWLVTPEFVLSETKAYTLEFWSYIIYTMAYQSSDIYISTGSKNPADGDYVLVKHLSGTEIEQEWQLISVSLSEYSGNSVYIAFKITTFDGHGWAIDDLKITETGTSITIFPWTEEFEDSDFPPSNWSKVKIEGVMEWTRTTSTTYNGSSGAAFHNFGSGAHDSWLITPEIVLPAEGGYTLDFWSYISSPSFYGSSDVYVSTGSNDPTSGDFVLVKHISGPDVTAAWRNIIVSLIPYSGNSIYIGFKYSGNFTHGWVVDNVSVYALSDYPVFEGPSSFDVGTVDSSESEPVTKEYGFINTGAAPLTVNFVSASPEITVTGLPLTVNFNEWATFSVIFNSFELPSGAYSGNIILSTNDPDQLQVTVNVSANVVLFTPTITEFPWTEDFELPIFPLPYWEQYQISGTSNWSRNSYYSHNSSGAAYHPGFVPNAETWLVTPEFVLSETVAYTLEFWSYIIYPMVYQSSDIYISTGSKNPADGDYVLVKHLSGTEIEQDWQLISVSLSEYSGNSVYIAFKITTFDGHGWAIDDLKIWGTESPDAAIFEGLLELNFGIVSNVATNPVTKEYAISNSGGIPLTVNFVSASSQVTVDGLPLSINPGATETISVKFNSHELPAGNYSGNFVLETNDLNQPQVTVEVIAEVISINFSPYIYEDFNDITILHPIGQGLPYGWYSNRFHGLFVEGIDDSGCLRASLWENFPTAELKTCYVSMGHNPILSFYYWSINFMSGAPSPPIAVSFQVQITKNFGQTWDVIYTMETGQHVPSYDYTNINVDVSDYANEICMVRYQFYFTPDYSIFVYLDDVRIGTPPVNDLAALSITGPVAPTVGLSSEYTVMIMNYGTAIQTDYTVRLMREGDIPVATIQGVEIGSFETKEIKINWIPDTAGETYIYAEVLLPDDEEPDNNKSDILEVDIQSDGTIGIIVGNNDELIFFPYVFVYRNSLTQSLYYPHEIGTNGGNITRLLYQSHFTNNITNRNIKIWIGETDETNMENGFIDPSTLTLVFDGQVNFNAGAGSFVSIPLHRPYTYNGGTLVIYSYKYDNFTFASADVLFHGTTQPDSKRSRIIFSNENLNPENPPEGVISDLFPYTTLLLNMEGMGTVNGIADNGTEPVKDAKIQIVSYPFYTFTSADGHYISPYLTPGEYDIEVSAFGYITQTISVTIIADESVTQNITLVPMPKFTVSGKVTGNNAPAGLAGVSVIISGYDTYTDTTDETGNYSISGVYGAGNYNISAKLEGYISSNETINVTNSNVSHNIILNEIAYPVVNPFAEVVGNNAVITWHAPGSTEIFRYDNGTATGQLGLSNELPNGVLGSCHRVNSILYNMSWFLTDVQIPSTQYVNLYIFDLDEFGMPTNNIIFSELYIPTTIMEWNQYEFPVQVEAPNGFFMALSRPVGRGLSLGTTNPTDEYPFKPATHFVTLDFEYVPFETIESQGYSVNLMLRAEGVTIGKSTNFGYSVDKKAPVKNTSLQVVYTPFEPVITEYPTKEINSKALTGYSVERLLKGEPEELWVSLSTNAPNLTYTDYGWGTLPVGVYQYAVKANYTGEVVSAPKLTNDLPKDMEVIFTVNVTTDSGDSSDGALVTLTNQDGVPAHVYQMTVSDGSAIFPVVWKGIYDISVKLSGYIPYSYQGIEIYSQSSYNAALNEWIITPYGLKVVPDSNPGDYLFTWNNDIFEDFENYENFIITDIGDWKCVDLDNTNTVGFWLEAGPVEWKNIFEKQAFIVFNPSSTFPALYPVFEGFEPFSGDKYLACWDTDYMNYGVPNNDWFISPKLDFYSEFTFSFWAKSFSGAFGLERLKVFYSTTGYNPEDFTEMLSPAPYIQVPVVWTQYSYQLPGDTKYVAFNCVSSDAWALMIDDIYIGIREKANRTLQGYTVYYDGVELTTVQETEYLFTNVPEGNHEAGVRAVFATGSTEVITCDFYSQGSNIKVNSISNVILYPNPFTNEIYINNAETVKYIYITDVIGRKLKEIIFDGRTIQTDELTPGVYFITLESISGEKIVKKMVKK